MSRTRRTCSPNLEKKLALYTLAAAGASAFSAPAAAQVIYTKTNIYLTDGTTLIDLNHDGVADFTLTNSELSTRYYTSFFRYGALNVSGAASEAPAILGLKGQSRPLALGVPHGISIGSDAPAGFISDQTAVGMAHAFINNDSNALGGRFANAGTKYLGLRFTLNRQVHYGWARLNVSASFFYPLVIATVSGYAYESTPGKSIPAGYRGFVDDSGGTEAAQSAGSLGMLSLGSAGANPIHK